MSSIRMIAEKAGVSVATVSHVLNKTRYVSPELTEKVERVMKEFDYKPNIMAGSLRGKKTKTIGLILPDSSNNVFSQIGQVIEMEFAKAHHNVIFCNSSYDVNTELNNIDTLRMKMVDGIIILPSSRQIESIQKLMEIDIPFVVANTKISEFEVDMVYVDNELLSYIATEYLIQNGCRVIVYLDRHIDHDYSLSRRKGYKNALEKYGMKLDEDYFIRSRGFSYEDGYNAVMEFLKRGIQFDALFSYNDTHAIGAIRCLQDQGLRVPMDVSVIGCDDIPVSAFVSPSLTTMRYPIHDIGKKSAAILLHKLMHPDTIKKQVVLLPELVIRESTSERT